MHVYIHLVYYPHIFIFYAHDYMVMDKPIHCTVNVYKNKFCVRSCGYLCVDV